MEKYVTVIAVLSIIVTTTITTDNHGVFAQEDKTQQCKNKQTDMYSKMKQWLSSRDVIDLSQPPTGYTKEDMDKLKSSVLTELCKIENCSR